jgi:site-specific DNA recombinase
MKENARQGF